MIKKTQSLGLAWEHYGITSRVGLREIEVQRATNVKCQYGVMRVHKE